MSYDMTAAEAAHRLGVKQATLYAYVSRGVLTRTRAADGRGSLFDADEVERLALRGRPRRPAGTADITVESGITEISADSLRYRGRDVIELARDRSLEDVAELLWAGQLPAEPVPYWQASHIALTAGQAAQAALPEGILPLERFQVIVPAMAATDPLRLQLDPVAVMAAGRAIVAGMVDCLPPQAARTGLSIAARLWSRLCQTRPSPGLLRALSAALVLVADHELAASTLAARAAASVRADPYAVVATGLGAAGGALHGGSSLGAETLLASAHGSPGEVPRVVGELLRRGERVPGFGHFVYKAGDPRAIALLELVRRAAPKSAQLAVADAVLAEIRQKSLPEPNIDFALATLAKVAGMVTGAAEAVFAVARVTGWTAHALEAYTTAPIRPRAIYTGP
ncbi:MAG TPA: citrate/2-methylcitrate synthase [Streptosporangiaceae bacterium]